MGDRRTSASNVKAQSSTPSRASTNVIGQILCRNQGIDSIDDYRAKCRLIRCSLNGIDGVSRRKCCHSWTIEDQLPIHPHERADHCATGGSRGTANADLRSPLSLCRPTPIADHSQHLCAANRFEAAHGIPRSPVGQRTVECGILQRSPARVLSEATRLGSRTLLCCCAMRIH